MIKFLAIVIFLLICILVSLGAYIFLNKSEKTQTKSTVKNSIPLSSRYDLTVSPLNSSQQQTYSQNQKVIDSFVSQINPELQNWMKNVVIIMLDDVDHHLISTNRPKLALQNIDLANDTDIEAVLNSPNSDTVIVDAREEYEKKFTRLDKVESISLSRLLNNDFGNLSKDQKIIVICHTASRGFITASYLKSQGFTNVKSYNGGVMTWQDNKYPTLKSEEFQFIFQTLPYLSPEKVADLKQSDPQASELLFDSAGNPQTAINPILVSPSELSAYIASLPKDKKYIINCTDNHHCFEASMFWDAARSQGLQFLGYTGFSYH